MSSDKIILNTVTLSMQSKAENVALARATVSFLAAQLKITVNQLEELKVAISEAVSNAIIHGYQDRDDEQLIVKAELLTDGIIVTIEDSGVGIQDIAQAMEPAFSTDPERMGLGFAFMKSFTDELEVESTPGQGTKIRLLKRVAAAQDQSDL